MATKASSNFPIQSLAITRALGCDELSLKIGRKGRARSLSVQVHHTTCSIFQVVFENGFNSERPELSEVKGLPVFAVAQLRHGRHLKKEFRILNGLSLYLSLFVLEKNAEKFTV